MKSLANAAKNSDTDILNVKDMYKLIQESGKEELSFITSQKILRKYILNLETDNKLMLDEESKIYSLV